MRETFTSGSVGRAPGNRCLYPEPDCLPPTLLRRCGFRQQVSASVRGLHSLIAEGVLKDNHDMIQVSVEDIQQNLLIYLQRVEAGETLVVVRAGQPVVEMKPVKTEAETLRPFGLCAGEFTVPEDFDAPLPEDLLQAFEGL